MTKLCFVCTRKLGSKNKSGLCVDCYHGAPKHPVDKSKGTPTIRSIQDIVARHYGLSMTDIMAPRTDAPVVRARHVAMYIAKRMTTKSLPQIGSIFNRDHTCIMHAVKRIEAARLEDEDLDFAIADLSRRITAQHQHALNEALTGWIA